MGALHTETDTYSYTAAASELRPKSRAATSQHTPSRMPRPSLVLSLLTVASLLLLPTIDATPVFVDNPSLAQCKWLLSTHLFPD